MESDGRKGEVKWFLYLYTLVDLRLQIVIIYCKFMVILHTCPCTGTRFLVNSLIKPMKLRWNSLGRYLFLRIKFLMTDQLQNDWLIDSR